MDSSPLSALPDELLEAIVYYLPPKDTVAFGTSCRRSKQITYEPLVWRRHCMQGWRFWEERHEIREKLEAPPAQIRWRTLFEERHTIDKKALDTFNEMLKTQQHRIQRIEDISNDGYDVKDLLVGLRDGTPDDAEDVLARRYWANYILGQIHRMTALEKWTRLQKRQMVRLEEVLGAYDLFVLSGNRGLREIDRELDRLAQAIRARDPEFDNLSTRKKSVQIARYLRAENLVGNTNEEDYHALRNNFISIALFDAPHTSLPLQSVAIYCAVARRLGVNAKPSNYPHHVHAVIEAPRGHTLDGLPYPETAADQEESKPETMHMDPWRSASEVSPDVLTLRLMQMGAPPAQHAHHLGATSTLEIALRTGRNIMTSVQEAREGQRGGGRASATYPDIEGAWYAMLWAMLILGDNNAGATLHRRRQCLPYLMEHYQAHYPEDLGLIERLVTPMFESEREHHALLHLITEGRKVDSIPKPPSPRPISTLERPLMPTEEPNGVAYTIGTPFRHARYGYQGFVIGWDTKCEAGAQWMRQMRVDELPRGREQPFYQVVADDKSTRYVAEENIAPLSSSSVTDPEERPCEALIALAGRYFKRWDDGKRMFVSNIRDQYPDD